MKTKKSNIILGYKNKKKNKYYLGMIAMVLIIIAMLDASPSMYNTNDANMMVGGPSYDSFSHANLFYLLAYKLK